MQFAHYAHDAMLVALGYGVSAVASALGVGASVVFVPALLALPAVAGRPEAAVGGAIATSLAASCIVTCAGAWAHWRAGNLPANVIRPAAGALAAAAVGGLVGGSFVSSANRAALGFAVVLAQAAVAAVLVWRACAPAAPAHPAPPAGAAGVMTATLTRGYLGLVGLLTSIGAGGVFIVPFLLWRGLARNQAAALASLLGVAIAPAATVVYLTRTGSAADSLVHLPTALALGIGAVAGARLGARLAARVHARAWTVLLACGLIASSLRAAAHMF